MKRFLVLTATAGVLGLVAMFSAARQDAPPAQTDRNGAFAVAVAEKNPWTDLTPNTDGDQFQFAIVSDRTGGHRKGVFSKAVRQINLLQPEFVMSVGDLIEGGRDAAKMNAEWDNFQAYLKQFQMPFFYAPGNHDADSPLKMEVWAARLGRANYHFVYKNSLFLVLNTNNQEPSVAGVPAIGPGARGPRLGRTQLDELAATVRANAGVRHTFVFLHHPLWTARDLTLNGWLEFEQLMAGRKHHVYCGHVHNYRKFLRNGTAYYQLATTGGGSALRGVEYGEFDQLAWVTMKKDGPVMANVLLNGLYGDDLRADETDEDGSVLPAVGLPLVTGTVTLKGKPAYGLNVIYTLIPEPKKADEPKADEPKKENPADVPVAVPAPVTGSSRIGSDGGYTIYGNRGTAGLRPGRYAVTFAPSENLIIDATAAKPDNPVPEKYRTLNATPFRVEVTKGGPNTFDFAVE